MTIEADGKDTTPDDQDEEAKVFDLLTPEPSNLSLEHAETNSDRRHLAGLSATWETLH